MSDINKFIANKYKKFYDDKNLDKSKLEGCENLILLEAKKGNQLAFNLIAKCYDKMILSILRDIGVFNGDERFDDYYSICQMCLWRCVLNYNINENNSNANDATFSTFLYKALERQKIRLINTERKEALKIKKTIYFDEPLKRDEDNEPVTNLDMYTIISEYVYLEDKKQKDYKDVIERFGDLFSAHDMELIKLNNGYTDNGKSLSFREIGELPEYKGLSSQRLSSKSNHILNEMKNILKRGAKIKTLLEETTLDVDVFYDELSRKTNISVEWLKYYYRAYEYIFNAGVLPKHPKNKRKIRFEGIEINEL